MRDPYLLLGVSREADDETIHAAYLAAVRACPPERDAAQFDAVRQAYESIATRRDRLAHELFTPAPPRVNDLLDRVAPAQASQRPTLDVFRALLRGEP
ncbi:J domain-containing protein [Aquisalimonas sp.]|uniref:J domain-containing protein n=1 Tax=Aquisalimonas sp. TaxID=1872621 RepID=UPI0025B7E597|nr:J domain-containing protein [Aquisalimonas sp.]